MKDKFVLAQLGCGYWGPNLLRNFSTLKNCAVKYVVDASAERRAFRNLVSTEAKLLAREVACNPQIAGTTAPGLRTLFITTVNNDRAVATGILEVK